MLQVNYIRENREKVLERLALKNFKQPELVDEIIGLDEERRKTQVQLDDVSAQSNSIAKQIGDLMRQGEKQKAESLKAESPLLKEEKFILQVAIWLFFVWKNACNTERV